MKAPILMDLDGWAYDRGRTLRVLELSVTLSLRGKHTAEMVIPLSEHVQLRDFILITLPDDGQYIFRVQQIDTTTGGAARCRLVHAIDTLNDAVMLIRYDSRATITGYLDILFQQQIWSIWEMGTSDAPSNIVWERPNAIYEKISALYDELRDALVDYYFTYSHEEIAGLTHNRVNIVKIPDEPTAEFRLTRNIDKCRYTVDYSDMANYMCMKYGSESDYSMYIFSDQDSIDKYGRIEVTVVANYDDVNGSYSPPGWNPRAEYAKKYFQYYGKPSLAVTIDGRQLKRLTGQEWDHMSVGKRVRAALPEYGETFEELCVSVTYPDLMNQPDRITVELGERNIRLTDYHFVRYMNNTGTKRMIISPT